MLGEAALTEEDACAYYPSYETAIHAIRRTSVGRGIKDGSGISVKLSALFTRSAETYLDLSYYRASSNCSIVSQTVRHRFEIDAEEADRLELSLDLMEALAFYPDLADFQGLS